MKLVVGDKISQSLEWWYRGQCNVDRRVGVVLWILCELGSLSVHFWLLLWLLLLNILLAYTVYFCSPKSLCQIFIPVAPESLVLSDLLYCLRTGTVSSSGKGSCPLFLLATNNSMPVPSLVLLVSFSCELLHIIQDSAKLSL